MINKSRSRNSQIAQIQEQQPQPRQRRPRRVNLALRNLQFGKMPNNPALGGLKFHSIKNNPALAGLTFNIKSNVISQQKPRVVNISQPFKKNGMMVKIIEFSDGKQLLIGA